MVEVNIAEGKHLTERNIIWLRYKLLTIDIHYKVHWRVGRRLGLYRLISVQPFIGSVLSIKEFCLSSVLWILEILCCLY